MAELLRHIEQDYAKGGILEFDPDKPTVLRVEKVAKVAADLAKKVKEAKDTMEGKLGAVLKEYSDRIKDVYQRAVDAKKSLTSLTGTISRKQFRDANNLIDSYNRTRMEFSQASRSAAGSPLLPRFTSTLSQYAEVARVTSQDLKGKLEADAPSGKFTVWVYKQQGGQWAKQEERTLGTDDEQKARKYVDDVKAVQGWTATSNLPQEAILNLTGTTWRQEAVIDAFGYDREEYRFQENGSLNSKYVGKQGDGSWLFTWKQSGNQITLINDRYNDKTTIRFKGTIQGKKIVGTWFRFEPLNIHENVKDTWIFQP